MASLVAQTVKRLSTMQETRVQSLGQEDPLEKEMATHSSTLAWRIPWTEEPCGQYSMGSQRVGHDWATSLSFFCSCHTHTCTPTHPWAATCLPELQFPWLPCVSCNAPGTLCPRSIALAFVSVGNAHPWNSAFCCDFFFLDLNLNILFRERLTVVTLPKM